jgi:hypothetical protein
MLGAPPEGDHNGSTAGHSRPARRSSYLCGRVRPEAALARCPLQGARCQLGGAQGSCVCGRPWCQRRRPPSRLHPAWRRGGDLTIPMTGPHRRATASCASSKGAAGRLDRGAYLRAEPPDRGQRATPAHLGTPVRAAAAGPFPGGYRLYTEADERRVRHMRACLARGLSAAEAARAALRDDGTLPIPAISSSHARPTEPRTWPPAWMPSTRQPLRRSWTGCWPTSPSSPS